MGNPKQKWTAEEEKALKQGVLKHGAGKWKNIHNDPEFHCHLSTRSNIDLKDKWRNMSSGQGPREKSRTPRPKPTQDISPAPVTPVKIQTQSVLPVANKPVIYQRKEEPAKDSADVKKVASDTQAMIFEALAAAKDRIGLDIGTIAGYIEQRMTVKPPQNFRKQVGTKLRNLVKHDKLEKVDNNCYRLKTSSSVEINRIDNRPKQQPQPLPANNKISKSLEEAAKTAAYKVVEAEETAYCAALAVTEYERLSQMQEETDSILHLAKEIYDRCHNREILLVS